MDREFILFIIYIKNPPKKSLDRAINFGKKYWEELLNRKS